MKHLKKIVLLLLFMLSSTFAQFGVNLNGGVFVPVSEFTNNYSQGFGGEITFIYRSNPRFEFGLITGYSQYSADEEALKQRIIDEFEEELNQINIDAQIDVEAPLKVYPLTLNIKYLFGNKKVKPYFFFEGGIFFYNLTTSGHIDIKNGPVIDIPESVEKENSTMLGIGGGIQFKISRRLFFDVSARWRIMNNIKLVEADINQDLKGTTKTAQTIGILGGLSYYF